MEPGFLSFLFNAFLIYGSPFLAFAFGVFISIRLDLNGGLSKQHVVWMSIPVGILTVGNLLMTITIQVQNPENGETILRFGHMNSVGQFLVFIGTVILYGTLVPQLFSQLQQKIQNGSATPGKP